MNPCRGLRRVPGTWEFNFSDSYLPSACDVSGVSVGAGVVIVNTCRQTTCLAHREHLFSGPWLQSLPLL